MRTKVTLALIFLNVALFFFIFKFERNWRTEAASLEARKRVLGPEAADIRTLEITTLARTGEFSLERKRDTWTLTKPLEWPANQHAARTIVNELQTLEHEASFTVADAAKNGQSLTDFGLDKPRMTVAFASGDPAIGGGAPRPATVLRIGLTTVDDKRLYVLSPDGDRVHVVRRSLLDSLSVQLAQLRADTLLSIRVYEARSLLVQAGAAGARIRLRRDGNRWTFESPITARASKTAIELAISDLNALTAKSFPSAPTGPLPSAAPALRVAIEGNGRQETLLLGEPVPAPTGGPAAAKTDPEYFAQLEGRNALFTVVVPAPLMAQLRNAQETLREKRILDFEPAAVTAITLGAPVLPNQPPLTLQRLEPTAGQTASAAPPWQIVRHTDGAQAGPQTLPADRALVQRLLERLALLSAEKFKSDAPTSADLEEWGFNRPVRIVTLNAPGSAAPVVVRLGTDQSRNVYARVGTPADAGTSIYQVETEILDDLPIVPLAWRDRAVAEPLPATARIASLKLTDLESKQALFEASFDANGAPTPAPADPKAVQAVLAALRALRAREFVPGGFAEKVSAAGDERPWRFQLDAAIALPGAGGAEQRATLSLFLTERLGGSQQFAGVKELDTIFALEQPFVDALWSLAYGARDPGPRTEKKE